MKTLIATDLRLIDFENRYYITSQGYYILKRYYNAFGSLVYCGRVKKVELLGPDDYEVTEWLCDVVPLNSQIKTLMGLNDQKIRKSLDQCDFVVARCGSFVAFRAATCAHKLHKPYCAEVMNCVWDGFWNHGIEGKILAPYMFLKMKSVLRNADYAIYVTNSFLQNRYPCKHESIAASNVMINSPDPESLKKRLSRIKNRTQDEITLMTTAAVDVRYKGQEYVIRAIPKLNQAGIRVKYILVGGGDQTYLRKIAEKCGVSDQVEFAGRMPLEEIFARLDETDIYIQPSLQEGLPRSVIEAMSRACPVIGAKTAGIPELIAPECVVKRKSARDIEEKIICLANPETMVELAEQNFQEAAKYCDSVLTARRANYFSRILEEIERK